jgi:4-hydroxybenzoate polyprenyltransferase
MEDVKGDRLAGAGTIAIRWQKKQVLLLCLLPVLAICGFTVYLYLMQGLQRSLFVLLLFFVVLPLLVFYQILVAKDETKIYNKISQLMKLDMFVLLIIFSLGRLI